ncbi:hypothetical protein [Asticcacaulis machinosus]|uniref:Uncharacterized protein n=1 Tax=Asticcacaulis machinosus TaxID=2984211 RepID=A0ABT5HGZ3_9CAUL|nr:hypothetical protein [Asticcacaulis machinosus]MDC7675524.1 hypothetical protein [Asticcacaulis machinosus]
MVFLTIETINISYAVASAWMIFMCLLHILKGGAVYVRPLFVQTELRLPVRVGLYFCWHLVSLMLGFMAALFALAAYADGNLGLLISLFAFACGGLNLLLALRFGLFPWRLPQWVLFFVAAALGFTGHAI